MKLKPFTSTNLPQPGDLIRATRSQLFLCCDWNTKKVLQQTCTVKSGDILFVLYREQKKVVQMNPSVSVKPDSLFYLLHKGLYYITWSESYLIKHSEPAGATIN